jgi:sodium pump decarboxylase gamma subunit
MLNEGLELMAVGMTTVFAFLLLLVALMMATGWYFQRRELEEAAETARASQATCGQVSAEVAAAIAAAYAFRRQGGAGS